MDGEDVSVMILDAMAIMADRTGRQDTYNLHIQEVSKILIPRLREGGSNTYETIVHGLLSCGTKLPFKAPMYATLAAILTNAGPEDRFAALGNKLVSSLIQDFTSCLRQGSCAPAKRILRYMCCLCNAKVINVESINEYIHSLLDAAHFELTTAQRADTGIHCRGQFLAEIALSSLPWICDVLKENDLIENISSQFDAILSCWSPNIWRCVAPAIESRCTESFVNLLDAITQLRDNQWENNYNVVPTPYTFFMEKLSPGAQIVLPTLTIPSHSKVTFYSAPRFRLVLVNDKVEKPAPPPASAAASSGQAMSQSTNTRQSDEMNDDNTTNTNANNANNSDSNPAENDSTNAQKTPSDALSADVMDISASADSKTVVKKPQDSSASNEQVVGDSSSSGAMQTESVDQKPDISGNNNSDMNSARSSENTNMNDVDNSNSNGNDGNGTNSNQSGGNDSENRLEKDRTPMINFVIRSYVSDISENFYERHLMAAERLLTMPMLKEVNDEIVECLFSQMCALPSPKLSPVYFGTLFADLCRVKDSRLPAKLLIAVQKMFQHADEFDQEIFDRLAEWFSFHLSNFGYKWNWQEWAIYTDSEMVDRFPYRALFCKDVIARCVRLSYYDRVRKILPEEMRMFLPAQPNDGDQSRFIKEINDELRKIVTGAGRLPSPQVKSKLEQLCVDLTENNELQQLKALINAVLQAGCRTLSHFDIVVERYMDLLRDMSTKGGQLAKRIITTEVNQFWKCVHIRRLYVMDKLSQYSIITHLSIIESCLCQDQLTIDLQLEPISDHELKLRLGQSCWWEIIRLAMSRARAREDGARKELTIASQMAAVANEGESEEAERRLERAKHNTEDAKRDIRELLLESLKRLFVITARLLDASPAAATGNSNSNLASNMNNGSAATNNSSSDQAPKYRLPGFEGKPIWLWRCTGMMRELARMHPQHLVHVMSDLDECTTELREKHNVLWESFDILREIEKCSLHMTVW